MNRLIAKLLITVAFVVGQGSVVVGETETGRLIGSVTDSAGSGLAWANVIVIGTNLGAMTRDKGVFVVRWIPVGRYNIKATMMGFEPCVKRDIEIRQNEATEVHFTLGREHRVPQTTTPPKMLTAGAGRLARNSLGEVPVDEIIYPDSLTAIRAVGLDFQVKYQVFAEEEVTGVQVAAFGRNNTGENIELCGAFVFVELPFEPSISLVASHQGLGHDTGWRYLAPKLKIGSRIPSTQSLKCKAVVVRPGETIGDTLRFDYTPEPYLEWPGETRFWCLYYYGQDGDPWAETKAVDIGVIVIPIR